MKQKSKTVTVTSNGTNASAGTFNADTEFGEQVYPPGTEVFVNGDIEGYITAVCWREGGIQYEITWWDDGKPTTYWFYASKFTTTGGKVSFGYRHSS